MRDFAGMIGEILAYMVGRSRCRQARERDRRRPEPTAADVLAAIAVAALFVVCAIVLVLAGP